MKFLFSLLLFLSFLTCSFAQDYIPLIEQNKHFLISSRIDGNGTWYNGYMGYVMRGDTLVEGENYTKVYRQIFDDEGDLNTMYNPPYEFRYEELFGLMREDLEERKVYVRIYEEAFPITHQCEENYQWGEEILYYDFGQSIGDTMSFCSYNLGQEGELSLNEINIEDAWGEERREFYYIFADQTGVDQVYIFEGLGSYFGIFSPHISNIYSDDEGWYVLLNICTGTNEECGIVDLVATEDILPLTNEIKMSPNPTNGYINLSLSEVITENGTFQITDLTGKVVYSEQLKSGNYIRQFDLPKGFYSASFQQEGQILWQNKLIVLP